MKNVTLKGLIISSNPFGDEGMEVLTEALLRNRNTTLTELKMWECGLSKTGTNNNCIYSCIPVHVH